MSNIVEDAHTDETLYKKELEQTERIWRISSLTASVDDETRILILPMPESKRETKIGDTEYTLKTYGDFAKQIKQKMEVLDSTGSNRRFSDKTEEEIQWEQVKKKK